jgi:uncharacterized alpha-E superfamily protein
MLSRVAESLYWMGRYLERAEHAARVLEAMRDLRLDLFEVDRNAADEQWQGALGALLLPDLPLKRLVLDPAEPTSLLVNVSRARENARQVREVISPEMWEQLNQSYWTLRDMMTMEVNESTLSQTLTGIVSSSFLWDGVTDASMIRGEGWLFLKLGKFAERIGGLARLVGGRLDMKARVNVTQSDENVSWLTLLKTLDAVDAYRKSHPARVDRRAVMEFLIFEADFPRAFRYSTALAADLAKRLVRLHPDTGRKVERAFGRIWARVEYSDVESLEAGGAAAFLFETAADVNEASGLLQKTFFLC